MDNNPVKLAAMIEELRLTRQEVSVYLGVSERTLYRWLTGQSSFPRMVFLALELYNTPR
jgi:DNA-binding transcriptional regulator YiaG